MSRFFIPANSPEDWKPLLAEPDKHWRDGYSAKLLAYTWQQSDNFPKSVRDVFRKCGIPLFRNAKLLLAFPEYKVPLPGGKRASQNDIFILAIGNGQLVSITVEGKVAESFDKTVSEWKHASEYKEGRQKRLEFICATLGLGEKQVEHIRYQLLHRTASAIIEARKFDARNALMLVHSFSQNSEGFSDYCQFLELYGLKGEIDSIVFAKNVKNVNLYLGWVKEKQR
jgi:hypothetical protein